MFPSILVVILLITLTPPAIEAQAPSETVKILLGVIEEARRSHYPDPIAVDPRVLRAPSEAWVHARGRGWRIRGRP